MINDKSPTLTILLGYQLAEKICEIYNGSNISALKTKVINNYICYVPSIINYVIVSIKQ